MLDLGPRSAHVLARFDTYLVEQYGRCRRCGGPRAVHLVRPLLRCEHECAGPA